jgi:hypothetical protein
VSADLMTSPFPRLATVGTAVLLLLFTGCKPEDDVRTYTVAREKEPEKKPAPSPEAPDKYRMLGAIIPAEPGYSWFVKFVGPNEVVSPHEAEFDDFVKSIKTGTGGQKLTWTAPPKWTEAPPRPTRLVTLKNGPAEMYLSGPFGGNLLDNVNRWRKEVGLRELKADELKDTLTEIPSNGVTANRVDLRGPTWSGGMVAPFAGGR